MRCVFSVKRCMHVRKCYKKMLEGMKATPYKTGAGSLFFFHRFCCMYSSQAIVWLMTIVTCQQVPSVPSGHAKRDSDHEVDKLELDDDVLLELVGDLPEQDSAANPHSSVNHVNSAAPQGALSSSSGFLLWSHLCTLCTAWQAEVHFVTL